MYIEHPFFIDGKYYAKIDNQMIEITKEVAYAMNNFKRMSIPKRVEVRNADGEVVEKRIREVPYSSHSDNAVNYSVETMPDPLCDVEDEALTSVRCQQLHQAIDKLTEIEKIIVRGIYFEDMTQEMIGKLLGISKPAVNKRLKIIFAKMKNMLE